MYLSNTREDVTMTKLKTRFIALILAVTVISVMLSGCDGLFGGSDVTNYDKKMESATGKWLLLDEEDTYFVFDGSEGAMTFSYYEDGAMKYSGSFRTVYRSNADASTPLTFIFTRTDKTNKDWLNCYVEGFTEGFTQFSVMYEEEDLGVTDGTVYTHVYRLSEMPYKIGTYVLEGETYKTPVNTGLEDFYIPEGTYVTDSGESLTVFPVINHGYMLFNYVSGETVVEGILDPSADGNTLYLYIEHDIYEKVRNADKYKYDTTFSLNYPPDFYLRGSFNNPDNSLVINGLYHHDHSPTEIEDSTWVFGTYVRQEKIIRTSSKA